MKLFCRHDFHCNRHLLFGVLLTFSASFACFAQSSKTIPQRFDSQGDLLPRSALSRLGSLRFQHGGPLIDIALAHDHSVAASISRDQSVCLWDLKSGKNLYCQSLEWGSSVAVHPQDDGAILAIGSDFGTIQLRATGKAKLSVKAFSGHRDSIHRMCFSREGSQLASLSRDGSVRVWNLRNGNERLVLADWKTIPDAVTFLNEELLILGDSTGQIHLVDLKTGKIAKSLTAHAEPILQVRIDSTGKALHVLSAGELSIWTVPECRKVKTTALRGITLPCAIASNAEFLLTATDSNRLTVVPTMSENVVAEKSQATSGIIDELFYFHTSDSLGMSHRNGAWQVWPLSKVSKQVESSSVNQAALVSISEDGNIQARGTSAGPIFVREQRSNRLLAKIPSVAGSTIKAITVSRDGSWVAVASSDSTHQHRMQLWQHSKPEDIRNIRSAYSGICALTFSADSKMLYGAGEDQRLHRWSIPTGQRLESWSGLLDVDAQIVCSRDGKWLASTNREGMVTLCDASTGQVRHHLTGHPGRTQTLAFSPDSRSLASGGAWDATVLIHEVKTGHILRRFKGHRGPVTSVVFSSDGRRLFSGSTDTTVLSWDIPGFKTSVNHEPTTNDEVEICWNALVGDDSEKADLAEWALASAANRTVPILQETLRGWMGVSSETILEWIQHLDARRYHKRQTASKELANHLQLATPALKRTLLKTSSLEVRRRIRDLLEQVGTEKEQQQKMEWAKRAISVLEKIANQSPQRSQAVKLLQTVKQRASDTYLQQEAYHVLARLVPLNDQSSKHISAKESIKDD